MQKFVAISIFLIILILGCQSNPSAQKEVKPSPYQEQLVEGKKIAAATFNSLSAALQKAMSEGGVAHAVDFCNSRALPITDSLSEQYNATIKRTSDKWRNPFNQPSAEDYYVIQEYQQQLTAEETLEARIKNIDGKLVFFAPIRVQGLCLNCHGEKSNIEDYASIEKRYPQDRATGYQEGDLRGVWSITFNKQISE